MFEAVMIAATGLRNQQRRLDTISDNIANVNTIGFKAERLDFKDALYTNGIVPGPARSPEENQQKGHGVMTAAITREFHTGGLIETGNNLDLAIEGKGYFSIEDGNGRVVYTRAGNFYAIDSENGRYLVNTNGHYVLDENGARIKVPQGTETISVSREGVMEFYNKTDIIEYQDGVNSVNLGIYTFRNETGLLVTGKGYYIESEVSGERTSNNFGIVVQGVYESSNVSLSTEFTRMIRTQRAFQLASRALTTADDMEGIANNLRK